jgi:hypothetical protein
MTYWEMRIARLEIVLLVNADIGRGFVPDMEG